MPLGKERSPTVDPLLTIANRAVVRFWNPTTRVGEKKNMHKISITPVPHVNRDGSKSATKKDYVVTDKFRKQKVHVGVASSMKAAVEMRDNRRAELIRAHVETHPNDKHFQRKHGIKPEVSA